MDTAHVIRLLEPREPFTEPSPLPFERGVTGTSPRIHALRKTLTGNRAVCDNTTQLFRLGGRFDPDDLHCCLACVILTAQ
ncbi:MAG: hypothetical protein JO246_00300 [Frankiaceae bacterium]|nr:hypothetical protein [Frankiaceae bacterium]MBV9869546.1 hypothetical protein [Frankiaceae bacterium]